MSVRVRLDDREDFLPRCGSTDHLEVVPYRIEQNFGTRRTQRHFGSLHVRSQRCWGIELHDLELPVGQVPVKHWRPHLGGLGSRLMTRGHGRREDGVEGGQRRATLLWGGLLVGGLIAAAVVLAPRLRHPVEEKVTPVEIAPEDAPRRAVAPAIEELGLRVIHEYPHAVDAFTQGLVWHEGSLYESTGRYGASSLRKVRLEDGKILAERRLEPQLFGEGLALVGGRLIQLTWREELAIVSDLATLKEQNRLPYRGEGWGLCFDGSVLVMSDGSSMLEFRDPDTMELLREITVLRNGHPVPRLNELECVGSEIYANIWQRDEILRIDGKTGRVTGSIDASNLLSRREAKPADVLNGIAYKPDTKTFLLTGKLWPHVFEVELVPR